MPRRISSSSRTGPLVSDVVRTVGSEPVVQLVDIQAGRLNGLARPVENAIGISAARDRFADAADAPVHSPGRLLHQKKGRTDIPGDGPTDTPALIGTFRPVRKRHARLVFGAPRELAAVHEQAGSPPLMGRDASMVGSEVQDDQGSGGFGSGDHGPGAFPA